MKMGVEKKRMKENVKKKDGEDGSRGEKDGGE